MVLWCRTAPLTNAFPQLTGVLTKAIALNLPVPINSFPKVPFPIYFHKEQLLENVIMYEYVFVHLPFIFNQCRTPRVVLRSWPHLSSDHRDPEIVSIVRVVTSVWSSHQNEYGTYTLCILLLLQFILCVFGKIHPYCTEKKKKPTFLPSFPKTGHKAYGIEYSCKGLDNFKTISPFQEENSWEFSLSIWNCSTIIKIQNLKAQDPIGQSPPFWLNSSRVLETRSKIVCDTYASQKLE